MTMWKETWRLVCDIERTTEEAGLRELWNAEGDAAERALQVAENTAMALAKLIHVLHDEAKLSDRQVVEILGLHGYHAVDSAKRTTVA